MRKPIPLVRPMLAIFMLGFFFFSCSLIAATAQLSTGWLISPDHPPVSVQMQLTGQTDPLLKTVNALLQVNLEGDWKTYWRSPGEGGIAPQLNWQSSVNISAVNWFWPAPKRYPVLGVETLGYKDKVQFPLIIAVKEFTQKTQLQATLTLASCTTICVLSDYNVMLSFNPSTLNVEPPAVFEYAQAVSKVPVVIDEKQIALQQNSATITGLSSYWDQAGQSLLVQVTNQLNWLNPELFVDSRDPELANITFSKPKISVSGKQLTATFAASSWAGDVDLLTKQLHITVIDKSVSVELISSASDKVRSDSVLSIFFVALLGGLILNIMPCVLPVLGMKLSSILSAQGIQRGQIRGQFLASSAGILSSFWLLALFLVMLKLSGQALGWGIQFQSPYFIAFMFFITALFAANMLGLFEIQLSSKTQTWLATRGEQSLFGHYLQGMFATLLATPCSAPFLGSAVAFALGASMLELLAIFSALGLGMALPWLFIATFPSLALLLPKPGKWMGTVKIVFALMMLATSFWLLTLLATFIGSISTLLLAALLSLLFFILILRKHGKRILVLLLALLILTSASGLIIGRLTSLNWDNPLADELTWTELNAAAIGQQVAAGKTVFVDVTADWCVTCKANKIAVLLQDPVYSALQAENIGLMEGDWTVRSDSVTAYLASFNRYGVPFNIVYGPSAPQGIQLPTILSSEQVLLAIKRAQGDKQ